MAYKIVVIVKICYSNNLLIMIVLWPSAEMLQLSFIELKKNRCCYNSVSPSNIIRVVQFSPRGKKNEEKRRNRICTEDYAMEENVNRVKFAVCF